MKSTFLSPRFPAINHARTPWQQALRLPGAEQLRHARRVLTRCGFPHLTPDPALLHGDPGAGPERIQQRAMRMVDVQRLSGTTVHAWWCDPRTGVVSDAGRHPRMGVRRFVPPCSGPGSDWVLVLDDADAGLAAIGGSLSLSVWEMRVYDQAAGLLGGDLRCGGGIYRQPP